MLLSIPNPSTATESSSASPRRTHAFVTVGSTHFDALVQKALSDSVRDVLREKDFSTLTVQCGNSEFDTALFRQTGDDDKEHWLRDGELDTEIWRFKPSLREDYERADLIISHAGSGTIIDVLRLHKPLIVVPNPTLQDNHQEELAAALAGLGHLKACTVADLPQTIAALNVAELVPFPQFDGSRFRESSCHYHHYLCDTLSNCSIASSTSTSRPLV